MRRQARVSLSELLTGAPGGFALDSPSSTGEDKQESGQKRSRLDRLVHHMERSLPLPNGPRGYLLYLCGLILIAGGMAILTLMSAQIVESQRQLTSLNREYTLIQQRNSELISEIARDMNLERVQRRLVGKGYVAVENVEFVVIESEQPAGLAHATVSNSTPPQSLTPQTTTPQPAAPQTAAREAEVVPATSPAQNVESLPVALDSTGRDSMGRDDGRPILSALGDGIHRWEALFLDRGAWEAGGDRVPARQEVGEWTWPDWAGLPDRNLQENLRSWYGSLPWVGD